MNTLGPAFLGGIFGAVLMDITESLAARIGLTNGVHVALEPATAERLQQTVERLKARLAGRTAPPEAGERAALMQRMQSNAAPQAEPGDRIKVIRAGVGHTVRMIPVADVVCFEATAKYVNARRNRALQPGRARPAAALDGEPRLRASLPPDVAGRPR